MLPVDQMEMDETIAREEGMSIPDILPNTESLISVISKPLF